MAVTSKSFGICNGVDITEYVMHNKNGMTVSVLDRGATIRSICVPDRDGKATDVVLALGSPADYEANDGYMGAVIGRCSNRIEKGEIEVKGNKYKIGINDGNNSLHGGIVGFDKKTWTVDSVGTDDEPALKFSIVSLDGEEGFPGNLSVDVIYKLTLDNSIIIQYTAKSDKDTVVNLTNHSYFNLAGHDSGTIDTQCLKLNSSFFTPNTEECMPNGEVLSVHNTPFDFTVSKTFGEGFSGTHRQVEQFGGFDHNFIIDGAGYRCCAVAENKENGICMECWTDKPGVQLYTSNALDCKSGKDSAVYGKHHGFCLETQFYPNSMKYSHFPSPILKAGEEYNYTTSYKFYIK